MWHRQNWMKTRIFSSHFSLLLLVSCFSFSNSRLLFHAVVEAMRRRTSAAVISALFVPAAVSAFGSVPSFGRKTNVLEAPRAALILSMSSTTPGLSPLHYLEGVSSLPDQYSTYLLDMWGVMHDGTQPYPGVLDSISHLKSVGKRLIILSNSSKRLSHATKMLAKLGFDISDFEQIITSGEVSWRMLSGDDTLEFQTWPVLTKLIANSAKKVFVFGSGDNDEEYCTTAGWTLAPVEEADLILARGTFTLNDGSGTIVSKKLDGEEEYFAAHDEALKIAAERNIPMLVSNPDRFRPDEGLPPMPGAIGDAYERVLGGDGVEIGATNLVKRIGKPHAEVYELALVEPSNEATNGDDATSPTAVMVGDALETDIIGGKLSSVATLWVVKDGIHGPDVEEAGGYDNGGPEEILQRFNDRKGYANGDLVRPVHVVSNFRW